MSARWRRLTCGYHARVALLKALLWAACERKPSIAYLLPKWSGGGEGRGELERRPGFPAISSACRYVSAILCTISVAERFASTQARPADARAFARSRSRKSARVASARA